MRQWLGKRARRARDRGASAVEYGLLVAAIAAVIVGTVFALGGLVKSSFDKTCSALSDPQGQTCINGVLTPPGNGTPPPAPGDGGTLPGGDAGAGAGVPGVPAGG